MTRLYALLLYLYPPPFRRAHGRELLQVVRTARARGVLGIGRLALDLAQSVPREWREAARARSHRSGARQTHRHRGELMISVLRDIRYALRLLRKSPGFATAAIITLALGIGANTAIFSLADSVLLHPVNVRAPERLVTIPWTSAYPDYLEYAKRADVFDGVVATSGGGRVSVSIDGSSELASAAFVSGNAFDVLGVGAAAGRLLLASDDVANGPVVAAIGYDYWRSRFGSDPTAIGKLVRVNDRPVTIVGVVREGFRGLSIGGGASLYLPLTSTTHVRTGFLARPEVLTNRGLVWVSVTLRLARDVTEAQASSVIAATYRTWHPAPAGQTAEPLDPVIPLRARALGVRSAEAIRRFVLLLAGVVVLTLLVGCANLANLLLARSALRRREVGIRMAMGGGRAQIVRQMLVESLVLALLGGLAGIGVASGALRLLTAFQLPGGVEIGALGLALNAWTLAVAAGLSLVTVLFFGLLPAWRASPPDARAANFGELRETSAGSRLRGTLVAAQVALSLVLLTGSGLFLRSLVHALAIPVGYDVNGVATASVNAGLARVDEARAGRFYEEALARVRALPTVRAAAWTSLVPSNGQMISTLDIDGYRKEPNEDLRVNVSLVGPEYFAAVGTPLLKGRTFAPTDNRQAAPVAIISRTTADRYWRGRDPIGGLIRPGPQSAWRTVIGVVEDVKVTGLDEAPAAYAYYPFDPQMDRSAIFTDAAHLMVRTSDDPAAMAGRIAGLLRSIDPDMPIYDVVPFAEHVRELVMPQRMGVTLFGVFSLLALSLACVGIYGDASYVATLRTRELGIRVALGAEARQIRGLVLRQAVRPAVIGIAVGVGLALWAARLAQAFLYDVSPSDPVTLVVVATTLLVLSIAATWFPARRAAQLDPVASLRHE